MNSRENGSVSPLDNPDPVTGHAVFLGGPGGNDDRREQEGRHDNREMVELHDFGAHPNQQENRQRPHEQQLMYQRIGERSRRGMFVRDEELCRPSHTNVDMIEKDAACLNVLEVTML